MRWIGVAVLAIALSWYGLIGPSGPGGGKQREQAPTLLATSARPSHRYETQWRRVGLLPASPQERFRSEEEILLDVIQFKIGNSFRHGLPW